MSSLCESDMYSNYKALSRLERALKRYHVDFVGLADVERIDVAHTVEQRLVRLERAAGDLGDAQRGGFAATVAIDGPFGEHGARLADRLLVETC